jgi:CRISPR/Cas system-associated exonuclease Cas4 (RecB family)
LDLGDGARALVRGSIDLVEGRSLDGRLRVTDYKTGRRSSPAGPEAALRGGRVVQPLLYALAAEEVLGAEVDAARLAYCTSRGGFESDFFTVGQKGRAALRDFLRVVDDAVAEGWFPAAPSEGDCQYCDFRPVCGTTEEVRAGRKRADDLARLQTVRDLP